MRVNKETEQRQVIRYDGLPTQKTVFFLTVSWHYNCVRQYSHSPHWIQEHVL